MPDAIVKSISGIFFFPTDQSGNQESKKMNQESRRRRKRGFRRFFCSGGLFIAL
jgi:hypothetical protein